MKFHSPHVLWLTLGICAVLIVAWHYLEAKAARAIARFATVPMLSLLLGDASPVGLARRRRARLLLGVAALLLVGIAIARPQVGAREEIVPSEGLDLVFVLDVSNSMLAEDVVPSRMKKAKHVIRTFLDRLSGDRVGVVAFAGSAYPAVPLTTDYDFIRSTLDSVDEASIANQGSDLAKGVSVGIELLARGGASGEEPESGAPDESTRVMVVLSDGESHVGGEAKLAPRLSEAGIRVFSIGVGSLKGSPIPVRDGGGSMRGYKRDASGTMIHTKLETVNLESIASATSGKYFTASTNEGEVEEILGELSGLDRTEGAGRRIVVYDELFQYPMALGVLLLILMLFVREKGAAAAALALLSVVSFSPAAHATTSIGEYRSTKKGVQAYEDKDYAGAVRHFGESQAADPDSLVHHMNLGDALLKAGSPEGAIGEFDAVTKSKNADEAARGAYNLGKAHEERKDLEEAIRSYQAGLGRLSDDPKSDPEVELRIKRALERAYQQQQQQKQDQQSGKGEQKGEPKDQKDADKNKEKQKYQISKQKPKFKGERLAEPEAKRIMKQLQEQEKKAQQRVMRGKTGKPKDDKGGKDW